MIARERDGELMTTTAETLADEVAMLRFARDGHRKFVPLIAEAKLPADGLKGLSPEQRQAAIHILNSRDTVTGIVGKAGTGKTPHDAGHGGSDRGRDGQEGLHFCALVAGLARRAGKGGLQGCRRRLRRCSKTKSSKPQVAGTNHLG